MSETFRTATRKIYRNSSGKDVVVTYHITGMGHALPVDPGTNTDQGGTTGAYSEDKDIYSSYYAAKFWGLIDGGTGDTTPPVVNITSPSNGATVSGTVTITASASDNVGVTKVEFYINNTKVGEDTTAPYEYNWNTTGYANGTYSLKAIAYDAANNSAIDNDTSVNVNNATGTTVSFSGVSLDDSYVKAYSNGTGLATGPVTGAIAIGRGSDGKYNRAILSFDTSSLPDNATITRAYIVVTYSSSYGDPWSGGNSLVIDIKNGYFGIASTIETADWGAEATANAVASIASFSSGTKQSSDFNSSGLSAINKTGKTQLKLRFVNNQTSTAYIFIKEGADVKLYVTYTTN